MLTSIFREIKPEVVPSNINTDSKQQRGKILTYPKKPMATSVNTGRRWTGGTGAGRGDGIMNV